MKLKENKDGKTDLHLAGDNEYCGKRGFSVSKRETEVSLRSAFIQQADSDVLSTAGHFRR